MNTAADNVGRKGRAIMSRSHGFWSLGSLVGALCATAIASWGIPIQSHFMALLLPVALVGALVAGTLPGEGKDEPQAGKSAFTLPGKPIILLCLMPVGIMLVEGAFMDWSTLFVKTELSAGPVATGLIFSVFALMMTGTRLCGDWLVERYGSLRVGQVSTILGTVGIFVFAISTTVPLAFVGAILSGAGVAIVYPQAMSAAAGRPGRADENVAAMSLFAFLAFMVAPPAIGALADWTSLRFSLLLLAPLAATSYLLSWELTKETKRS